MTFAKIARVLVALTGVVLLGLGAVFAREALIVLSWLVIIAFGIAFNVAIGRSSKSRDPEMNRHAKATTTVTVLEVLAVLFAGSTLLPAAVIYPVSATVMVWRFVLLIQTRRRARRTDVHNDQ